MVKNMKIKVGICIALLFLNVGCAVVKDSTGTQIDETGSTQCDTEREYVMVGGRKHYIPKMDYDCLKKIDESADLYEGSETEGIVKKMMEITFQKVYFSQEIEELEKWSDVGLSEIQLDGNVCQNGRIIYMEFTIKNVSDEEVKYYASNVGLVYMDERENVRQATTDVGYFNYMSEGHDGLLVKIQPGESKEIRIGYFIPEETFEKGKLYIDATMQNPSENEYKVYYSIPDMEK